ncbi:AraC family transcriptional regulator (plasmid) [Rhodococcus sp. ZPP]|uniref:AraC family transcriptional regulator n=1 Tax=Rhodococcus sp. ZPP TaxID=2749906 RepID=UPI001AD88C15|nr:AraC family transcriptional regulator [Rhodococcus sp. ZPP]QTJ70583.1 AraC family transcriptional regulator [Rhodococcus sp. ZPP]
MTPIVRAGALQGFDDLVRRWGADPARLRRQHGLAGKEIEDPESMVSLNAVAHLLDDAARVCDRPDFGLRLGATQNPQMLGLLAVVIQGSNTAGAALLDSSRYLFVHSPSYQLVLEPSTAPNPHNWVTLRFDVEVDPGVPYRQIIDGCLASLLTLARGVTGLPITPLSVSLPHTPAASPRAYRSVFGAPVAFGQPKGALHLDPNVFAVKLHHARPAIRRAALAYIAARLPHQDTSAATRVRNTLGSTIGATRGTKSEIADLLSIHPRTLQRRLHDEGTTFEQIRDEVHRTATLRLLTESNLPFSQVSYALGFSDQSAMSRKVRQWFGTTATQMRAQAARSAARTPELESITVPS